VSETTKSDKSLQSEADRLYASIKHKRAATAWRSNNYSLTKAATALGSHRVTLSTWKNEENWQAWGDALDADIAAEIAAMLKSGAIKHQEDMETLLSGGRAIAGTAIRELLARMKKGHSWDLQEANYVGSLLKALQGTGASLFNLEEINLNVNGNITVEAKFAAAQEAAIAKLSQFKQRGSSKTRK
jgi:hypothetical protein